MSMAPVLKMRHQAAIRDGILAGRTQEELARELGIGNGTVAEIAPRVSSLTPQSV